jgi:hypothetical protein
MKNWTVSQFLLQKFSNGFSFENELNSKIQKILFILCNEAIFDSKFSDKNPMGNFMERAKLLETVI